MGATSSQAVAITVFLIGFTLLAGAFAAGSTILAIVALLVLVGASFLFSKCKAAAQRG
jgi:hypothetical protein